MKVDGPGESQEAAARFVRSLKPRGDMADSITLSGELGAGKTTFAQGIAKALGVEETVTSPTFVLEKIYKLENQKWQRLVHIDAYRLKSAHELEVLGWKELLADAGNLIVLEWPERVAEAIPSDAIRIRFDIQGDERIISINGEESGKK
jgi:tRNA threonylcarbamoyladenosine biosynthesis protein TsaE